MADLELVVKIPEEDFLAFSELSEREKVNELSCYERMIANGTPIPKGHGDLVDKNYLLSTLQCEEYETCTWRSCSDCNQEKCIRKHDILEAPTIIEAEGSDKECI